MTTDALDRVALTNKLRELYDLHLGSNYERQIPYLSQMGIQQGGIMRRKKKTMRRKTMKKAPMRRKIMKKATMKKAPIRRKTMKKAPVRRRKTALEKVQDALVMNPPESMNMPASLPPSGGVVLGGRRRGGVVLGGRRRVGRRRGGVVLGGRRSCR